MAVIWSTRIAENRWADHARSDFEGIDQLAWDSKDPDILWMLSNQQAVSFTFNEQQISPEHSVERDFVDPEDYMVDGYEEFDLGTKILAFVANNPLVDSCICRFAIYKQDDVYYTPIAAVVNNSLSAAAVYVATSGHGPTLLIRWSIDRIVSIKEFGLEINLDEHLLKIKCSNDASFATVFHRGKAWIFDDETGIYSEVPRKPGQFIVCIQKLGRFVRVDSVLMTGGPPVWSTGLFSRGDLEIYEFMAHHPIPNLLNSIKNPEDGLFSAEIVDGQGVFMVSLASLHEHETRLIFPLVTSGRNVDRPLRIAKRDYSEVDPEPIQEVSKKRMDQANPLDPWFTASGNMEFLEPIVKLLLKRKTGAILTVIEASAAHLEVFATSGWTLLDLRPVIERAGIESDIPERTIHPAVPAFTVHTRIDASLTHALTQTTLLSPTSDTLHPWDAQYNTILDAPVGVDRSTLVAPILAQNFWLPFGMTPLESIESCLVLWNGDLLIPKTIGKSLVQLDIYGSQVLRPAGVFSVGRMRKNHSKNLLRVHSHWEVPEKDEWMLLVYDGEFVSLVSGTVEKDNVLVSSAGARFLTLALGTILKAKAERTSSKKITVTVATWTQIHIIVDEEGRSPVVDSQERRIQGSDISLGSWSALVTTWKDSVVHVGDDSYLLPENVIAARSDGTSLWVLMCNRVFMVATMLSGGKLFVLAEAKFPKMGAFVHWEFGLWASTLVFTRGVLVVDTRNPAHHWIRAVDGGTVLSAVVHPAMRDPLSDKRPVFAEVPEWTNIYTDDNEVALLGRHHQFHQLWMTVETPENTLLLASACYQRNDPSPWTYEIQTPEKLICIYDDENGLVPSMEVSKPEPIQANDEAIELFSRNLGSIYAAGALSILTASLRKGGFNKLASLSVVGSVATVAVSVFLDPVTTVASASSFIPVAAVGLLSAMAIPGGLELARVVSTQGRRFYAHLTRPSPPAPIVPLVDSEQFIGTPSLVAADLDTLDAKFFATYMAIREGDDPQILARIFDDLMTKNAELLKTFPTVASMQAFMCAWIARLAISGQGEYKAALLHMAKRVADLQREEVKEDILKPILQIDTLDVDPRSIDFLLDSKKNLPLQINVHASKVIHFLRCLCLRLCVLSSRQTGISDRIMREVFSHFITLRPPGNEDWPRDNPIAGYNVCMQVTQNYGIMRNKDAVRVIWLNEFGEESIFCELLDSVFFV